MKTTPKIPRGLIVASLAAAFASHAHADPFVGTFKPLLDNNDNIRYLEQDGLERIKSFSVNVTKSDANHYRARLSFGSDSVTVPTKKIGNRLVNSPRPTNMGGWKMLDLIMLSDGTNRAMVAIGQDGPTDIGCAIATWSDYKGRVTVDDFVGTWKVDSHGDDNLLNTKDGFEQQTGTTEIRKLDSSRIQLLQTGRTPITLRVSGNEASLQSAPVNIGNGRFHTFRLITDGKKGAFVVVGTELSDPTDVSATIGLAVKQGAEISVQQPAGTELADGKAKISFGTRPVGAAGRTKTFYIRNRGGSALTGLAVSRNGPHARDFIVSAPPVKSLAPGKSTSFKVTFKPTAKGARAAAIRITSNDQDENPFEIGLTGLGAQ